MEVYAGALAHADHQIGRAGPALHRPPIFFAAG
jgi:hypothetical protein